MSVASETTGSFPSTKQTCRTARAVSVILLCCCCCYQQRGQWDSSLRFHVSKIDQKTNFPVHLIKFSVILCHGSVRCLFHCSSALMPSALLQRRLAGRFERCTVVCCHAGLIYCAAFVWLQIHPSSYSAPVFSFEGWESYRWTGDRQRL